MLRWVKISVNIPLWLLRRVDKAAEDFASDRSHYVRTALIEKLRRDEEQKMQEPGSPK